MMNLANLDEVIAHCRKPLGDKEFDEITELIAQTVEIIKESQMEVIDELLTMYLSASEHNVDIGREAIYSLAMRLKGSPETRV